MGLYESVRQLSEITYVPVTGPWSASNRRHQMKKVDTSVWASAPQETSVTKRWMEVHQRWVNTPNNFPAFIPPSVQQMLQLAGVFFPMVQCGSTFVYLCTHSRPCLEWMWKLDVQAWSCGFFFFSMRRWIAEAPSCTLWGFVTPFVNLETDLWPFEKRWNGREASHFPPPGSQALLEERKHR